MTCLVVGGAGNLGSHIVLLLLEREYAVSTFDLFPYTGKDASKVQSFIGDITDVAALEVAMAGINTVFHVASIIDIKPVPSLKLQHVNISGTLAVIAACKAVKVASLIYTASLEVVSGLDEHGVSRKLNGVDETCPIPALHHLPYAGTKAYAERLVLTADSAELRTCSIRPGYIYGVGCIGLRMEMLLAAQRSGYYVTAHIPATISTVHPKNCALVHVLAAEQISKPDVHGQCFFSRDFEDNVVSMNLEAMKGTAIKPLIIPLSLAYLLAWVLDTFERWLIYFYSFLGIKRVTPESAVGMKAMNMAYIDIVVSDEKAKRVLGFKPLVDRAKCMQEAATWCEEFYPELVKKQQLGM